MLPTPPPLPYFSPLYATDKAQIKTARSIIIFVCLQPKLASRISTIYALKIPTQEKYIPAIEQELSILTHIRNHGGHPQCIELHGSTRRTSGSKHYIAPILEFLPGMTWHTLSKNYILSLEQIRTIARQVLSVLVFLRELDITHGDLAPTNIQIYESTAKVFDFGAAFFSASNNWTVCTPPYAPPKSPVIQAIPRSAEDAPFADSWMLGAAMYQAATGDKLYRGGSFQKNYQKLFPESYAKAVSLETTTLAKRILKQNPEESTKDLQGFIQLLKGLLRYNPQRRLLPSEALQMPFFSNHH